MRRATALVCLWICCAPLPALASESAAARPNVLFIASDDLRPELGCYGVSGIKTPNIDRLAARGVRFERAYCQYPLCNPSRTSMLTGRQPTTTGVLDNLTWFRAAHPDWKTLPQVFKENGYASLRVGKIFHGGIDDVDAWTEGGEARRFEGAQVKKKAQVAGQSDRIVVLEGEGESHLDFRTAARAAQLLETYRDKPFFLGVGFSRPHSPPTAPKKFFEMYDPAKMPLPPDFAPRPAAPEGFPEISIPKRNSDLFIGRDASPDEAREVVRAYYASVSFMDAQVGRVLDALERLKLAERTIIVFWGDHGYHLGEKGKWSKHGSLYEVGDRVPLIIALPGGSAKSSPRTVQSIDIFPTLLELAGLARTEGLEGHSLVPLLENPRAPWDHPAFTVGGPAAKLGRAVRNERYRYVEWDQGRAGRMLFDLDQDPNELRNLAEDPTHAGTVAAMRALLKGLPSLR